ncbi:MAG: hypothetical protein E7598_06470 [Ruminococcaceae bacterium]|nr:hypothetical protein [Oscillospiraceae bacterium]
MKQKYPIPTLEKPARLLAYTCLSIILLYILCIYVLTDNISPFLAEKLIQSALASIPISLFGALLLDLEIRHAQNR